MSYTRALYPSILMTALALSIPLHHNPLPMNLPKSLLVKGGRVIDPANGLDAVADVLILEGKIAAVGPAAAVQAPPQIARLAADGKVVCPGLIDLHAHLREPGQSAKETIATGTAAAARGGFASVVCMPNTSPAIDNAGTVALIRERAEREGKVNVFVAGAITKNIAGEELASIGSLQQADARVDAQLHGNLPEAGIDGGDLGGACLQKAIGKPARGGAHVEAGAALDVDLPVSQRRGQLEPTSAHVGLIFAEQTDGSVGGNRCAGFLHLLLADQNPAGQDERARPLPAGNQSPLDQ